MEHKGWILWHGLGVPIAVAVTGRTSASCCSGYNRRIRRDAKYRICTLFQEGCALCVNLCVLCGKLFARSYQRNNTVSRCWLSSCCRQAKKGCISCSGCATRCGDAAVIRRQRRLSGNCISFVISFLYPLLCT